MRLDFDRSERPYFLACQRVKKSNLTKVLFYVSLEKSQYNEGLVSSHGTVVNLNIKLCRYLQVQRITVSVVTSFCLVPEEFPFLNSIRQSFGVTEP